MTKNKTINLAKLKTKFLEYYREFPIQRLAASSIGRDEDTIMRWKKEDADFAVSVEAKKAEWALEQVGKVKSAEWLLERVMKEHFSLKTETEHGVSAELERVMQYVRDQCAKEKRQNI